MIIGGNNYRIRHTKSNMSSGTAYHDSRATCFSLKITTQTQLANTSTGHPFCRLAEVTSTKCVEKDHNINNLAAASVALYIT